MNINIVLGYELSVRVVDASCAEEFLAAQKSLGWALQSRTVLGCGMVLVRPEDTWYLICDGGKLVIGPFSSYGEAEVVGLEYGASRIEKNYVVKSSRFSRVKVVKPAVRVETEKAYRSVGVVYEAYNSSANGIPSDRSRAELGNRVRALMNGLVEY